jgi:hypothetical protein
MHHAGAGLVLDFSEGCEKIALPMATLAVPLVHTMAYLSKLQVIQRAGQSRQYYLICPVPLATALDLEKGEQLQWTVKDRNTFEIRRLNVTPANKKARH